jgi:hypothetical protein
MPGAPTLLRRKGRRGFRRFVYLSVLAATLLAAPSATGIPGIPGDPTPPVVTPLYSPAYPASGWFRGSVTLSWHVVDPESIILKMTGCQVQTFTTDTAGTPVTCSAESDGGTNSGSVKIKLDKTAPTVNAVPERAPDANGWYNRPVAVSFSAADATSGVASCSPATRYGGPDISTAAVVGTCTDVAGNVATAGLSFKYDATPPTLFSVTTKRGNRSAELAWRKSGDTRLVEVVRAPGRQGQGESVVYSGSENGFRDTGLAVGRTYEYRVTGVDEAANRAEHKVNLVATGPLLNPTPGERVTVPPRLVWTPVKGATHYNLQLIRGRKVLSAWPAQPGFRLRRTWIYDGRRYQLRPGLYRWYVWPGFRRGKTSRFGRLLGSSTFVVTK